MTRQTVEEAHDDLTKQVTQLLYDFVKKYLGHESELYPQGAYIMQSVLSKASSDVERQLNKMSPFTYRQQDHICFQIGEWYLNWRDVLMNWDERTHRLGFAKEELKQMICGD